MEAEEVLVFIKPDGLHLKKEIINTIVSSGFTCEEIGFIGFNEALVRCFYPLLSDHVVKKCIVYFGDNLLPAYIICGQNAIDRIKIIKWEFRNKYGNGRTGAIMHSTNEESEFRKELEKLNLTIPEK